jgi:C1A family cysteine protease
MPYRALGAIPDTHDPQDSSYEAQPQLMTAAPLPPAIDLRGFCSPVRDQGQQGSCTGFAIAVGLREFMERRAGSPNPPVDLAPAFVYYEERKLEGTVNDCNAGAMIRDGMKSLNKIGVSPESTDPYNAATCGAPSAQATSAASALKIAAYHRVASLFGLKHALASGHGCVIGVTLYASFESPQTQQTGHVPMPQPSEQILGGHAMFCCGYRDDATRAGGGELIVKNSWGTAFGDNGYVYMPYGYVTPKLMSDIWTAM